MGVWIETGEAVIYDGEGIVTPFVGVWIETVFSTFTAAYIVSHPSWVCGLKQKICYNLGLRKEVTPFVGVWIETGKNISKIGFFVVTPFVGVWIETF